MDIGLDCKRGLQETIDNLRKSFFHRNPYDFHIVTGLTFTFYSPESFVYSVATASK